jgi:hypothetical protein
MKYFIIVVIIVLLIGSTGCSDDKSNPANQNNPINNLYGSGSLSFNADSIGNFSFSGSWTGAATGSTGVAVAAWTGQTSPSSDYEAIIYARTMHSTTNFDYASLVISVSTPITSGSTYTFGNGLTFMFAKGESSMTSGSNMFVLINGTCQVTSYSASGMQGTITGTAMRSADQAMVSITNGSFNVTFGTSAL